MNPKRQNKTEKKSIFKPHDAFFKANMSKPEVIKDFLQSYLPIKISELVEYDSLLLVEPKSISPKLKLQEADLLYRIKIANQDSFLLFLMEHKSYTDIHTSIQILRYIVEIWDNQLRTNHKICPVLPLIFYQGVKKWNFLQLKDVLHPDTPKELLKYLPLYEALFYDFSLENKEKLKGHQLKLELYLRMIRAIYEPEKQHFIHEVLEIFKGIRQLEDEVFFEYGERTIAYISAFRKDFMDSDIIDLIKQEGGDTMETIIDRLEKRGRLVGRQEGRQEGRLEGEKAERIAIAREMKEDGFAIDKIMRYTKLSEEEILAL